MATSIHSKLSKKNRICFSKIGIGTGQIDVIHPHPLRRVLKMVPARYSSPADQVGVAPRRGKISVRPRSSGLDALARGPRHGRAWFAMDAPSPAMILLSALVQCGGA